MRFKTSCFALIATLVTSVPLVASETGFGHAITFDALKASQAIIEQGSAALDVLNDFERHSQWDNLPESARELAESIAANTPPQVSRQLEQMRPAESGFGFSFDHTGVTNESMADNPGTLVDQSERISRLLPEPGHIRFIVYLSFSMPDPVFADIVRAINARDDTAGVIQGLLEPDHTIPETIAVLYQRLESMGFSREEAPSIYIDPGLFTAFNITAVPKIIRFDGETPTISIKGLPNINYLEREYAEGQTGALGVHGNLYPIHEENLLDTIARRAQALDGEKLAKQAIDRFWSHQRMYPLPMARETSSYLIDPTIVVREDIIAPQGIVIARAGDHINPLDQVPFNRVGIIFDATDDAQIEWAVARAKEALANNNIPVVMTTVIDYADDGWAHYATVNDRFPMGLKLLDHMIIQRFDIQHAPSMFEQHGRYIKVTEVFLDEN